MLQPARRKYRKDQKGRNYGVATRGANVSFGDFGLKATERGRLTARQIEAARRAYDDWWQALGWIRDGLIVGGMLREVEVTGAMPRPAPWARVRPSG